MAEQLLPLQQLNVAQRLAELRALLAQAEAYRAIGGIKLPGIPDINKMIRDLLKQLIDYLLRLIQQYIDKLLQTIMQKLTEAAITVINGVIRQLNRVIREVNRVIDQLMPMVKVIFYIIIAVSIIYAVSKVIGLIPSVFVGMGSGIAFTSFITTMNNIMNMASGWLDKLHPAAFAIIAAMLLLIKYYGYIQMVYAMIQAYINFYANTQTYASAAATAVADSSTGAAAQNQDTGDGGLGDLGDNTLVACTLPDGNVKDLSPQACIDAGGTFEGQELLSGLNDLNNQINALTDELGTSDGNTINIDGSEMVDCILPDGTWEQLTLNECHAAGGRSALEDELARLKADRDGVIDQLGKISGFQLDENIITSLIHPNDDITVEKATKRKGKRYGFYQSYRRIKNEN